MKTIAPVFTLNADKCGNHLFTKIKREGNVAIYKRTNETDKSLVGYEVFIVKIVLAGAKLPNNTLVAESYEQYPGSAAFGKTAKFCATLDQAERCFKELQIKANTSAENKADSVKTGVVRRGRRASKKIDVTIPSGEFTMKMLISTTKLSQPQLYPFVKQWLKSGKIKIVKSIKSETGRGRPSFAYVKN